MTSLLLRNPEEYINELRFFYKIVDTTEYQNKSPAPFTSKAGYCSNDFHRCSGVQHFASVHKYFQNVYLYKTGDIC